MNLTLPAALIAAAMALALTLTPEQFAVPVDRLTPGVVITSDPDVICQRGYSSTQRVWEREGSAAYTALRRVVFERYSVPYAERSRYELDDRVPLCLGGMQIVENLWPQLWPEAKVKDKLEAEACRAACENHTVEAVKRWQARFLGDWRELSRGAR